MADLGPVSFVLRCQTTEEKKNINISQMQFTTQSTKSTRKSEKLLTILVAFSSDFMKWGTCLFILYKNMCYVKRLSFNTFLLIILQSPNVYVKNVHYAKQHDHTIFMHLFLAVCFLL